MALCNDPEGRCPVEGHMGWITSVMPMTEIRIVSEKHRHQSPPPVWGKQLFEPDKLFGRMVKVLRDLGTGDEIIWSDMPITLTPVTVIR